MLNKAGDQRFDAVTLPAWRSSRSGAAGPSTPPGLSPEMKTSTDQRQTSSSPTAFTLIEVMIVVAILGILVAVIAPSIQKFFARSRQQEIHSNMKAAWAAGLSYYAEFGTVNPRNTGFRTNPAIPRYSYHMEGEGGLDDEFDIIGSSATTAECFADFPPEFDEMPADKHFAIMACGNVDGDARMDWWVYTHDGGLQNAFDDVTDTAKPIIGLDSGPLLPPEGP